MAREKFAALTEQMFYILLALDQPCCGVDIMDRIRAVTSGRVSVGPGTLYTLLAGFQKAGYIEETAVEGRKITLSVRAFDECGPIGSGTHERFVITVDRFLAKAQAKKAEG